MENQIKHHNKKIHKKYFTLSLVKPKNRTNNKESTIFTKKQIEAEI